MSAAIQSISEVENEDGDSVRGFFEYNETFDRAEQKTN